jgi:hypothetical protein
MAVITTRPLSPQPGVPFTGYFIYLNAQQERKMLQIVDGNPELEPVELIPGRYNVEWVQAEKEPIFDLVIVPDEAEVELSDICASLKGDKVNEDEVKEAMPQPQPAADAGVVGTIADPTVVAQPPATEQEVAPQTVSTKRGGGASTNA